MTKFLETVSRETQPRLDQYAALLRKWQARINLVAPDTLDIAAHRHFEDSLQLLPFLPEKRSDGIRPVLVDLGSGAGFPGLVLAIARPDIDVHLVESDAKKCEFLKTVSRETHSPVTIHTTRIEALAPFYTDLITARALASLDKLLAYTLPFVNLNPGLVAIFPKGENWGDEVEDAKKSFRFQCDTHESQTNPRARILVIRDIQRA